MSTYTVNLIGHGVPESPLHDVVRGLAVLQNSLVLPGPHCLEYQDLHRRRKFWPPKN
jgi:hypothetical protein